MDEVVCTLLISSHCRQPCCAESATMYFAMNKSITSVDKGSLGGGGCTVTASLGYVPHIQSIAQTIHV